MEGIRGKRSYEIDAHTLDTLVRSHEDVLVDIGTGDGRFARELALHHPGRLVIGVDACRENLRERSRKAPENLLFVIANALALPRELEGLGGHVTINFPWGSLLRGLLDAEPSLLAGLAATARPEALVEVRLNAGALDEAGWSLERGTARIAAVLASAGFSGLVPRSLDARALRGVPSTWARRLAFGRDPRAVELRGVTAGRSRLWGNPP